MKEVSKYRDDIISLAEGETYSLPNRKTSPHVPTRRSSSRSPVPMSADQPATLATLKELCSKQQTYLVQLEAESAVLRSDNQRVSQQIRSISDAHAEIRSKCGTLSIICIVGTIFCILLCVAHCNFKISLGFLCFNKMSNYP